MTPFFNKNLKCDQMWAIVDITESGWGFFLNMHNAIIDHVQLTKNTSGDPVFLHYNIIIWHWRCLCGPKHCTTTCFHPAFMPCFSALIIQSVVYTIFVNRSFFPRLDKSSNLEDQAMLAAIEMISTIGCEAMKSGTFVPDNESFEDPVVLLSVTSRLMLVPENELHQH